MYVASCNIIGLCVLFKQYRPMFRMIITLRIFCFAERHDKFVFEVDTRCFL